MAFESIDSSSLKQYFIIHFQVELFSLSLNTEHINTLNICCFISHTVKILVCIIEYTELSHLVIITHTKL